IWYNNVGLANGTATAPTPITTTVGTSNFYVVDSSNAGCKSTPSSIVVNVNATPIIGNVIVINPTACATNTGSIKFDVSPSAGTFTVSYTKNGGSPTVLTNVTPVAGVITINNLGAGTYTSIFISQNNCSSNNLGPITLSDPTKPATPILTGNTPICSGGTLNLGFSNTFTGTATYTWSGPNGFSNATASPTINNITVNGNGTYSLSVSINGCNSDAGTIAIQVNQTPAAPTATTPITYCQNATATALTATGTNLIWYNNVGLANGTSTAPTPITTTVGTSNFYVVDSSNAGCKSTASLIVVNVNATPVIGNVVITNPTQCASNTGSIKFDVSPTTGTFTVSYTKNGGSPTTLTNVTATASAITIGSLGAGLYDNIRVSLNNCPSNILGPITLSDPTPPITPIIIAPANICSGNTLNLSASTTSVGTATYQWTGPSGFTATGA
ncbi:MAG: hypothetical protein ACOVOV_13985, partial [Dolichospermum sp.]